MSILWCGGEDIDFPNGAVVRTQNGAGRSGYARVGVFNQGDNKNPIKSNSFQGGSITSGWLSFYVYSSAYSNRTGSLYAGLALLSTVASGIYIGIDPSIAGKGCLYKYDGTTWTALASEPGTLTGYGGRFDVHISNFNDSGNGNVKVYLNRELTPLIDFTGNLQPSGVTNLDCVGVFGLGNFASSPAPISEVIVADEDTRTMSLVTNAPNGAGTSDQWTGDYTMIDEAILSDADNIYDGTTGHDFQSNLTDLPAGNFAVKATKIACRALCGASGPQHIGLGYNVGGTVSVGADKALASNWQTVERLDQTNPVNSAAWTASDINSLQLDLRTGA